MTILCACTSENAGVSSHAMPSLRELLAAHAPLLVIDAASTRTQVGWLRSESVGDASWQANEAEAGIAVFQCIERLAMNVNDVRGFVFCDGPGSILGIRTVAMALRTWCVLKPRPVFAYSSLALVAHDLGRSEVAVIADARRDSWHRFQLGRELERVPTANLTGELVTPAGFRNWTPLPSRTVVIPYALDELLPRVIDANIFRPTDAPDAFLHEEPNYVTWTPQIHRAPKN